MVPARLLICFASFSYGLHRKILCFKNSWSWEHSILLSFLKVRKFLQTNQTHIVQYQSDSRHGRACRQYLLFLEPPFLQWFVISNIAAEGLSAQFFPNLLCFTASGYFQCGLARACACHPGYWTNSTKKEVWPRPFVSAPSHNPQELLWLLFYLKSLLCRARVASLNEGSLL